MFDTVLLDIRPSVAVALRDGRPVVALESTLIAHGLPWPLNLETARPAEAAVRAEGAVPATIAVWQGRPTIGLNEAELEQLAPRSEACSRPAVATWPRAIAARRTAATTVAATMFLAHRAGIRVFATGGIGGVHPAAGQPCRHLRRPDELARTPVAVVCAGAKSILDLPPRWRCWKPGVPVVGYGTRRVPGLLSARQRRASERPRR